MIKFANFLILCFLLISPGTAAAKTYKWVDKDGVTHFSDTPVATEETPADIQVFSGDNGTAGDGDALSKEWFDDTKRYERSKRAAAAFLEQHENWPEKPRFGKFERAYAGQNSGGIGFEVFLPKSVLKGSDCYMAYQIVKVMVEYDPNRPRQCRITSVELYGRILEPHGCLKK